MYRDSAGPADAGVGQTVHPPHPRSLVAKADDLDGGVGACRDHRFSPAATIRRGPDDRMSD